MSRVLLTLVIGFLFLFNTNSVIAQESWWDFYDLAMKDIAAKNWNLAEERLKAAYRLQPEQGPKVRTYGARFIRYFPEYYLGVVHFHQGKHQEALEEFLRVQNKGLIQERDPEGAELNRLKQQAFAKLNPSTTTPTGPTVSEQYASLIDRSQKSLKSENYEEARNFANQAVALGTNDPKAKDLLVKIDLAENADQLRNAMEKNDLLLAQRIAKKMETLDPDHPELVRLRELLSKSSDQENRRQFASLLEQAERQLSSRDFANARKTALQAQSVPGADPNIVQALLKKIDIQEKEVLIAKKPPEPEVQPVANPFQEAIQNANREMLQRNFGEARKLARQAALIRGADRQLVQDLLKQIDVAEKNGTLGPAVIAFYSGRYSESTKLFEQVVAANTSSAKARFYLGCSYAALAFLQQKTKEGGTAREKLLASAREQFSESRKINSSLKYDQRFISPRILQIYERIQ